MTSTSNFRLGFPRLAFSGEILVPSRVALMPSAPLGLSEHTEVFGSPVAYYGQLNRLKAQLGNAEILGRGGAGFPLSQKIAAYETYGPKLIVVANASESEPLVHKDAALMARHVHLVVDGLAILGSALGAKTVFVHLKDGRDQMQARLEEALEERRGLDPFKIKVSKSTPGIGYVSGVEGAVISSINGSGGKPLYLPDRPIAKGVQRKPTLLANIESLAQLAMLTRYGANWFAQYGGSKDAGTRLITLTLPNGSHRILEVAPGTRVGEILTILEISRKSLTSGLIGGYFGQLIDIETLWDLELDQTVLRSRGLSLGAGIIALSESCPLEEASGIISYLASQSSGQCGPCYMGLPSLAEVFDSLAKSSLKARKLHEIERIGSQIIGRGGCAMPDGAVLLARSALARFSSEVRVHQSGGCSYPKAGMLLTSEKRLQRSL